MRHGIVIGKFYPPHEGHHSLIQTAIDECDRVTIAVCYSSVENINVEDRMEWIAEVHNLEDNFDVEIISVLDDTPVLYTDETWEAWLGELMDSLDWQGQIGFPNIIYSGENYADEFSERLLRRYNLRRKETGNLYPTNIDVRMVDRSVLPVSASLFRHSPSAAWKLIKSPSQKASLCKRVVICGAESSGTTTLTKDLAQHYDEPWVPEFGRYFTEGVGVGHVWTDYDFMEIAGMQQTWIEMTAKRTRHGLLLADTDAYATLMFSGVYLGEETEAVRDFCKPADLYIVTSHNGVEFEDDGFRENEHKRADMTNWFVKNLPLDHEKIRVVSGTPYQRLYDAVDAIEDILMNWGIEEPMEYRND